MAVSAINVPKRLDKMLKTSAWEPNLYLCHLYRLILRYWVVRFYNPCD
jgi:hypothetical protein